MGRQFEGFLISSNLDVFKKRKSTLKQKTINIIILTTYIKVFLYILEFKKVILKVDNLNKIFKK